MITALMIISYPNLFETSENLSGVQKYSCSLLIDKSDKAGIKALEAEIQKATDRGKNKLWSGRVPNFRYQPLRDGDAEIKSGEKEAGKGYEGRMFLNSTSDDKSPPGVVGPNGRPLLDASSVYSGCVVRADIKAFPYKNAGNSGIGWWLNHVMLVEECAPEDRLDGKQSAENAFSSFVETEGDLD